MMRLLPILRGGVDQAQAQHLPALAGVAPEGVSAARAGAVAIPRLDVLAIGAGRTQAPALDGRHPRVDASNGHPAPAGVELVPRGKLAERRRRGTRVLVDDDVVLFRLRLALLRLTVSVRSGGDSASIHLNCPPFKNSLVTRAPLWSGA